MGLLEKLFGASTNNEILIESFESFYNTVSSINRAIDLLINSCAMVDYMIYKRDGNILEPYPKKIKLQELLINPSNTKDNFTFYKEVIRDLMFAGNSLIYNTRLELQRIPDFEINNGKFKVKNRTLEFENCAFIKLIGEDLVAEPYIKRIEDEKNLLIDIYKFLGQYFKNNSFLGIVIKTERTLSRTLKDRMEKSFKELTSLLRGRAFHPVILDGGANIERLNANLKDTDIPELLRGLLDTVYESLGIPKVLISSGNNANITPNIKVFYYFTVLPICEAIASGFTLQLRNLYKIKDAVVKPDLSNIQALKDDIKNESLAIKSLYSVGIISRNEARKRFGYTALDEDKFLEPVNITGQPK